MKPTSSFRLGRFSSKQTMLALSATSALLAAFTGCVRRPIIVQAPPATVIQAPTPAPAPASTTVINTPAAETPSPTGREVIMVKDAPPPPREEPAPPPPPSSEMKWVAGYWAYRDGHQEWITGHYETPPRSTAVWVAPRWERHGSSYVFIEGYWQ